MKNNNVLNVRELHNSDIDLKDCKFCAYNDCPSDQSPCWVCKDKSEFKTASFLEGLEFKKLKTFSHILPFGEDYSKVQSLLSVRVDLSIAICACSDPFVLNALTRAYSSLTTHIDSFIKNS